MAGHAHDVRLHVRREIKDLIGEEFTMFLSFSPMLSICIEIVHQAVFVAEGKCVASIILPADVHG